MKKINSSRLYLYKRIVDAKLFIDKYYQSEIDIDDIAQEAKYSKFHFIRLFKNVYGLTPRQYLITKRIDFAKQMLCQNHSVTLVCMESGFSSMGSFSTLFKERIGCSPSEYRHQQLARQAQIKTRPKSFIPGCFLIKSNFQEANESTNVEI